VLLVGEVKDVFHFALEGVQYLAVTGHVRGQDQGDDCLPEDKSACTVNGSGHCEQQVRALEIDNGGKSTQIISKSSEFKMYLSESTRVLSSKCNLSIGYQNVKVLIQNVPFQVFNKNPLKILYKITICSIMTNCEFVVHLFSNGQNLYGMKWLLYVLY